MSHLLYNARCTITRELIGDDGYGGAVVTGTSTIASKEPCRFDYYMPKISMTDPQGLETEAQYSIFFRSTRQHPINIREHDIITIVFPTVHSEYNKRFRVRGVQRESLHPQDPTSIIECTLVKIKESRSEDLF